MKDSSNISNNELEIKIKEANRTCEKLKKLIAHRDNEISKLILII